MSTHPPKPGEGRAARDQITVLRAGPVTKPAQLDPARRGRKPKLEMPAMPQEVFDGMSALERRHYDFFVESIKLDYGITKPSDMVALHMAALEYINLLRVSAKQLADGEVITAMRQHPGVQLRAWLDTLSTTRKARKEQPTNQEDEELARWKENLRSLSR